MPNWCTTGITFYSKDKELVEKFHNKVTEIINGQPTAENGFGNGWLGDFANKFFPKLGHDKISCRGVVGYADDCLCKREDYWFFQIATDTAWSPKLGIWNKIVERFYKGINIAYIAEESGCQVFCKWDETGLFYPETMYVDCYYQKENGDDEYIENHDFASVKDVVKWLNENIPQFKPTQTEDLRELEYEVQEYLEKIDEEFYFTAELYEEEPPENYEL